METTQPTRTEAEPTTSRRKGGRGAVAMAGATIAAGVGAALVTTPLVALISFNHNETIVRTQPRSRRVAVAATGATVAAGVGASLVATPLVAVISFNHNETIVRGRSPGRS